MKHTTLYLFLAVVIICMNACSRGIKIPLEDEPLEKIYQQNYLTATTQKISQKAIAQAIYDKQHNCTNIATPESKDCNGDIVTTDSCGINSQYCNEECIKKIMYCHEICEEDFIFLTTNNGIRRRSKPFSIDQFYAVMDTTNCQSFAVRCYVYKNQKTYYRMASSATLVNQGDPYETFYSVALMKGILKYTDGNTITGIRFYKSIPVDDDGQEVYMLPIEVIYENGSRFYDLSNDFP